MLIELIAVAIFTVGYIGIATEHKLYLNKAAWSLTIGGLLWALVALSGVAHFEESLHETGYEIFSLVVFLLAAMSLVEILISCGVFDALRTKILGYKFTNRKQFLLIIAIAFVLSAVVDNLTATIISVQIARKFFKAENLVVAAAGIVLAANAGGAFSPIGDVTTIMLWIAGKFSATEIVLNAILPSIVICLVGSLLLLRSIDDDLEDDTPQQHPRYAFSFGKKVIIACATLSFLLPIVFKFIHLPPVLGILTGLGVTWLLVDFIEHNGKSESRLSAKMESLIQKIDVASIKFFIGILLAVSALSTLGVLDVVSNYVYGPEQIDSRVIVGNIAIGVVSSILDNIPLTAIAIDILQTTDSQLWILLAICVGTGGSLLSIGSAAGVVAMGLVKDLTFKRYFQIAFVPAALSFAAGIVVWYVQWQGLQYLVA